MTPRSCSQRADKLAGGDESVHSLIDAIYSRIPCTEFQRHVRIHPTVSELLPTAMERLQPL